MNLSNAISKLQWSIRQRGLIGTVKQFVSRASAEPARSHPFDALHGTDTGGVIGGGSLGAGHANAAHITAYAGMPPSRFEATLDRWLAQPPLAPIEQITFIDIGCGKGRVVLLASQRSFARGLGVELDPSLVRIAQANLALWHPAAPTEVLQADATEFPLAQTPTLLYLANPFGAPVLRRLLQNLEAHPTPVDLIYQNPEHRAVFTEFPSWRQLWDEAFPLSEEDAAAEPVYRSDDRCIAFRHQP